MVVRACPAWLAWNKISAQLAETTAAHDQVCENNALLSFFSLF
jgi:hypothetical protein